MSKPQKPHPDHPVNRSPAFAQQVFDSSKRPQTWLHTARRLRASADAIFEKENPVAERFWDELRRIGQVGGDPPPELDETRFPFPNFDAAYMLIAFAIENLLKGLALAKGIVSFTGQRLPEKLGNHDLVKLRDVAAPVASVTDHMLESLTYMSVWRARYPMPKAVDLFWPMRPDGTHIAPSFSWPQSHLEMLAYYDALDAELLALIPPKKSATP